MKKITIFSLALLTLTLAACGKAPSTTQATPIPIVVANETLIAEGRLEPIHYAEITFNTSGKVSEVLVQEGQVVNEGDPLIRLGNENDPSYAAAQLELVNAQKAMDDLVNSRGADFAQAVIDLHDAEKEYTRAENYLRYLKTSDSVPQTSYSVRLVQTARGYEYKSETENFKGPASDEWILNATNDLALKKAALENAQRAYDNLKDGPNAEQLPVLDARLNAAKVALAAFTVTAPFDGMIANLDVKVGGSINAGQIAVTVADFSSWIMKTTDLTELDVVTIKQNQPVTITLDALPGTTFDGMVQSIAQTYTEVQGDIVYEVTVLLTDSHPDMRWGMTAIAQFAE
jgi:multidrug resistance efflux pump